MNRVQHSTASATLPAISLTGTVGYYSDGNPATNTPPTWLTAGNLNQIQEELVGTISYAGLTPSNSDTTQLRQAIQSIATTNANTAIAADKTFHRRIGSVASYTSTGVGTGTTTISTGGTPTISDGTQILSATITPLSATSTLDIHVTVHFASSVAGTAAVTLFEGSNLLAISAQTVAVNNLNSVSFSHRVTSGSASIKTYTVRIGNSAAATITFNGVSGASLYTPGLSSNINITEILPAGT